MKAPVPSRALGPCIYCPPPPNTLPTPAQPLPFYPGLEVDVLPGKVPSETSPECPLSQP